MLTPEKLNHLIAPMFPGLMGVRVIDATPQRVRAELTVRPDLCTAGGILHGGAYMAFADALGAIGTVMNLAPGQTTTTTDSSTKFIRGAPVGTAVTGDSDTACGSSASAASRSVGRGILWFAPKLMKFLSWAGTAAMFLVGGGILVHGLPALGHWIEGIAHVPPAWLWTNLANAVAGIIAGTIILLAVLGLRRLRRLPAAVH